MMSVTNPDVTVQAGPMDGPDPEIPARAQCRTWTAAYEAQVLAQYDAADKAGRGAILRREGPYTSLIAAWREQRDTAALHALGRVPGRAEAQTVIDTCVEELAPIGGMQSACRALRPRSRHYRHQQGKPAPRAPKPTGGEQPRALNTAERPAVLDVVHSSRFVDSAPGEIYATLLDEGTYLCSEASTYRLLRSRGEVRERRRQAPQPHTRRG